MINHKQHCYVSMTLSDYFFFIFIGLFQFDWFGWFSNSNHQINRHFQQTNNNKKTIEFISSGYHIKVIIYEFESKLLCFELLNEVNVGQCGFIGSSVYRWIYSNEAETEKKNIRRECFNEWQFCGCDLYENDIIYYMVIQIPKFIEQKATDHFQYESQIVNFIASRPAWINR